QPPTGRPITHLSVTSFRSYLRCPFSFYLQHALRLRTVDPLKAELDDLDFGRLCHSALEELGRDPTLRHCADESRLSSLLLEKFDHLTREKYGLDVPVPLSVQLESAWQRLARAARVQAAERAAGWVIERIEHPFTLPIGGLTVRGTIDRIERNEQTGAIRVI